MLERVCEKCGKLIVALSGSGGSDEVKVFEIEEAKVSQPLLVQQ